MYFHVRVLRHVRSTLTENTAAALAVTLVRSRLDYANSILFKTSTSNIKLLQRAQNTWHRLFSQISGPLQLHLSFFDYTGYQLSHASDTNWQLLPVNYCQLHNQPTCICYFSSINPLDPFGQVARTCWHCLHCHPSLTDVLLATVHRLLEQVIAVHPMSRQFQLVQILSKNTSVCSSLI